MDQSHSKLIKLNKLIKTLFVIGTRPEAIKLYPVINAFLQTEGIEVLVCSTGQHSSLLDDALTSLELKVDISLNLMTHNQGLAKITSSCIESLNNLISDNKPDLVFVQGDTTSAFAGALAAFYNKTKIAHIEAGLRSDNIYSPFPEEANRKMISTLSHYHFCPTENAADNLRNEGYSNNVYMVGNTVIDSLQDIIGSFSEKTEEEVFNLVPRLDLSKKIILVTAHRRENFGIPLKNICDALKELSADDDIQIVYPVHPNPNVNKIVESKLGKLSNVILAPPLNYRSFIWLMNKSAVIVTDSGGIQEEAISLSKFVVVTREETERQELIDSGWGFLVGTDINKIVNKTNYFLSIDNQNIPDKTNKAHLVSLL